MFVRYRKEKKKVEAKWRAVQILDTFVKVRKKTDAKTPGFNE
jgi:hypothetical protein